MKINEETEVTVPLKTLLGVISTLLVAAFYVFTTQARITELEHSIELINHKFDSPSRAQGEVDLIKKDIEYMRKDIDDIKVSNLNRSK